MLKNVSEKKSFNRKKNLMIYNCFFIDFLFANNIKIITKMYIICK